LEEVRIAIPDLDPELLELLTKVEDHRKRGASAVDLADALGLQRGVSGYVYHTVPLALYCWLRHSGDSRRAVEEVIALGGDADSMGAIVGGLAGATVGVSGIPEEWIGGLLEWPRSVAWMRRVAASLASQFPIRGVGTRQRPLSLFWPGVIPRNLVFLVIVLLHGLRRLLPPY
jgi:hypothetical protein